MDRYLSTNYLILAPPRIQGNVKKLYVRCEPIRSEAATDVKRKTILRKNVDEAKKEILRQRR